MAFSGVDTSLPTRAEDPEPARYEEAKRRWWARYPQSFPRFEIEVPAPCLRNRTLSRWVHRQGMAVCIGSSGDLAVAIAAGIHPMRCTVHADSMPQSDLRATANLELGRIAVSSRAQIQSPATLVSRRARLVLCVNDSHASMTPAGECKRGGVPVTSAALDAVIDLVMATKERFSVVGLRCEVGRSNGFVSCPAVIDQIVTEMARIRRRHGVVVAQLSLCGAVLSAAGAMMQWPALADQLDDYLKEARASLRYPRPTVRLCPGVAILTQSAA